MEKRRVSFRELKQQVSIEAILSRYDVRLRKSGLALRGACPLPCGEDGGEGCFSVNSEKQVYHCFHKGCGAKKKGGDVLDLVKTLEGCSLREAGLKIAGWFGIGERRECKPRQRNGTGKAEGPINPPLDFCLKLDFVAGAEYMTSRGFAWEAEFALDRGIGVCEAGIFKGRLAIPLCDEEGELVGYAARSLDDSEPKYLFPSSEHGFRKSQLLYGLHEVLEYQRSVQKPRRRVVVVEGFLDRLWIDEVTGGGFCAALMGSALSEWQEQKLCEHFDDVLLLLDGDEAGRKCAEDCAARLSRRCWVRVVRLEDGQDPKTCSVEWIHRTLNKELWGLE